MDHRAVPTGGGPRPGVVVVYELYGRTEMHAHTDPLATMSCLPPAVELLRGRSAPSCLLRAFRQIAAGTAVATAV